MIFAINSRMMVFIFANNVMKESRCLQLKPFTFARNYNYQFANVTRLSRDFAHGRFDEALGSHGRKR